LIAVLGQQPLRGCVRRMRQQRRIPDEERFLRRRGPFDEIKNWPQPLAVNGQPRVAVPSATGGVAVRHALGEAAAPGRPFPPLARLQGDVAAPGQPPGQGRVFLDPVHQRFVVARIPRVGAAGHRIHAGLRQFRIVASDAVLMGKQAGDDRGQRRAAQRGGHIPPREGERLPGKPVQHRRLDVRVSHEAVIRPCLVVRNDEQNVRRRRGGRPADQKAKRQAEDQSRGPRDHPFGVHASQPTTVRGFGTSCAARVAGNRGCRRANRRRRAPPDFPVPQSRGSIALPVQGAPAN
jgi:hypothetical protein